jgi:hypothetical protein
MRVAHETKKEGSSVWSGHEPASTLAARNLAATEWRGKRSRAARWAMSRDSAKGGVGPQGAEETRADWPC